MNSAEGVRILVVIPARGGSKRIPRKNVQLMGGKPLILYAVENALSLKDFYDADVAASTDDEELAHIVEAKDVEVLKRGEKLSSDRVTLDPVIYDSVIRMEENSGRQYDIIITMQATSPTLKKETLRRAVEHFLNSDFDTLISVVNKPHLSWTRKDGLILKNYEERLNSQELPPNYLESGAFLMTRRSSLKENSRIGEKVSIYETSPEEAIDIDNYVDWIAAEAVLNRKRILFRTVGKRQLGMGHIYRCISLAYKLVGHELLFVTDSESRMGIERLKESFFPYRVVEDDDDFEDVLVDFKPDIVVNDILDTDEGLMKMERRHTKRIVNFEDTGSGAYLADAVINALYENHADKPGNVYEGSDYYFIRDEFLEETPKEFSEECLNIMVIFGGADPSDLTGRLYDIAKVLHDKMPRAEFHFIIGFAYLYPEKIKSLPEKNIFVHRDVKRVSSFMKKSDLAITSQGRTIYELASMGVPAIVLAQNDREAEHVFGGIRNGFINLGVGERTDAITIIKTIQWLADTPNVRREMRMLELDKEFTRGRKRVIGLILNDEECV